MARKPTTIDEYLARVKGDKRTALDKLRKTIRAIVPKAEECISYAIPAFRLEGNPSEPLPVTLVRKLISARIAEDRAKR
jgi:uncharacterized protein YdhG (YjbR/CyaY superfamily)